MNNKRYTYVLIVALAFAVFAVAQYSIVISRSAHNGTGYPNPIYPTASTSIPGSLSSNTIVAPLGWFVATTTPYVLLTRHGTAPVPEGTELYAYGTFMLVERVALSGVDREEWIATSVPADDPLVMSREWVQYAGRDMYEVVQQAAGAEGDGVTYYYFGDTDATLFSLYPYGVEGVRNDQGISDLEQVAEAYLGQSR